MIFRLTADVTFDADDLDDAVIILAEHFQSLREDWGSGQPAQFTSGEIELKKVPEEETYKHET